MLVAVTASCGDGFCLSSARLSADGEVVTLTGERFPSDAQYSALVAGQPCKSVGWVSNSSLKCGLGVPLAGETLGPVQVSLVTRAGGSTVLSLDFVDPPLTVRFMDPPASSWVEGKPPRIALLGGAGFGRERRRVSLQMGTSGGDLFPSFVHGELMIVKLPRWANSSMPLRVDVGDQVNWLLTHCVIIQVDRAVGADG